MDFTTVTVGSENGNSVCVHFLLTTPVPIGEIPMILAGLELISNLYMNSRSASCNQITILILMHYCFYELHYISNMIWYVRRHLFNVCGRSFQCHQSVSFLLDEVSL